MFILTRTEYPAENTKKYILSDIQALLFWLTEYVAREEERQGLLDLAELAEETDDITSAYSEGVYHKIEYIGEMEPHSWQEI